MTDTEKLEILEENRKMRKALEFIEAWNLPKLLDHNQRPVAYGVMRGSNGERDFIRGVAREAL